MPRLSSIVVVALSLIAAARPVRAQADAAFDFLATPASPMMCRQMPATVGDSAAFVFQLVEFRRPVERTTVFGYDSSGAARYARTSATAVFNEQGDGWAEIAAIRFAPETKGIHVRKRFVASVVVPDSTNGITYMKSADLARALALGDWIWAHRCTTGTTSETPSGDRL